MFFGQEKVRRVELFAQVTRLIRSRSGIKAQSFLIDSFFLRGNYFSLLPRTIEKSWEAYFRAGQ